MWFLKGVSLLMMLSGVSQRNAAPQCFWAENFFALYLM